MVTATEKTDRTLSTPDEIAAYLGARYEAMGASARFKPGDPVRVTARAGMPPDLAIGDVVVVVASMPGTPFTYILSLHSSGSEIIVQVMTDNLTKCEATT